MSLWMLAQAGSDDGFFPDTAGGVVVWVIVAVVIVGLYVLLTRTRRSAYDAYWKRRRAEEEARLSDPDMRRDTTGSDHD